MTMECCRCHDHKYDPLSQREYYQLSAYFDKIDEAGLYSYFTSSVPTPTLPLTDGATKQRLRELEQTVLAAEQAVEREREAALPRFQKWLSNLPGDVGDVVEPVGSKGSDGAKNGRPLRGQIAHLDFDDGKVSGENQSVEGKRGKAVKLSGDDAVGLKVGNFARHQPFSVSWWMNTPNKKERAVVFHRSRAWTDAASRGYQVLDRGRQAQRFLDPFLAGECDSSENKARLAGRPVGETLSLTYDGSSRAAGLRLHVDGELAPLDTVRDHLVKNITGGGGDNIAIGERFRDRGFTNGLVDEFRVFDRELASLEARELFDGAAVRSALAVVGEDSQSDLLLFGHFLAADEQHQAKLQALRDARAKLCKLQDGLQEIMVMREMESPRQTFLLTRGAYDARADAVAPSTPETLTAFPQGAPSNRLGLARWMCLPEHPLTSRVAVNRVWQLLMGQGIVRTPEDFGRQGQPPTHPELLDWLATDFVSHDWDVKRLAKQIVMSSTYRQSSEATAELRAADPENRLWGRAGAYRLPAEMLRDNALAVSGLLVEKRGGPPVKPYELEASFKPSPRDKGEGLYRRSLYTYWKRTGPAPMMMVLDSAKRDVCRVKRERTATPLESFVMMNSPQFVEASRASAERLVRRALRQGPSPRR